MNSSFFGLLTTSRATRPSTSGGPTTNFVTSYGLGTPRTNGGNFYTGFKMTIGGASITVTELGRYCASSSSQSHTTYLASSDGTPLASVSIDASAGANDWVFASITSTVLSAGAVYYVMCQEFDGGDTFYDANTSLTTTAVATVNAPVYLGTYGGAPTDNGAPSDTYGPVTFKYTS